MEFRRLTAIATASGLAALCAFAGNASAAIPTNTDGQSEQANSSRGLDHADTSRWGWDNTTPGVAGRPYIKRLAVSNDGGATFDNIVVPNDADGTNGWAPETASIGGQVSDIEIQADEIVKTRSVLNEILAHHTGQPIERIAKDTDRDRYLTAIQAKEYGLVDDVLTKPPVTGEDEEKEKD